MGGVTRPPSDFIRQSGCALPGAQCARARRVDPSSGCFPARRPRGCTDALAMTTRDRFIKYRRTGRLILALTIGIASAAPLAAQVRVDHGRHTRLQRFGRDMAYGTVEALAFAGLDQANNSPPQWGSGTTGYQKR